MEEIFKAFLAKCKTLPDEDHSESKIEGSVTHQYEAVNVLDYSDLEGSGKDSELTIMVGFANLIDMSGINNIDRVKIRGQVNIVDLSEATIRRLDCRELEVVHLDLRESKIEEELFI